MTNWTCLMDCAWQPHVLRILPEHGLLPFFISTIIATSIISKKPPKFLLFC